MFEEMACPRGCPCPRSSTLPARLRASLAQTDQPLHNRGPDRLETEPRRPVLPLNPSHIISKEKYEQPCRIRHRRPGIARESQKLGHQRVPGRRGRLTWTAEATAKRITMPCEPLPSGWTSPTPHRCRVRSKTVEAELGDIEIV